MSQIWKTAIEHIVVVMMENRSFDHLLGNFKKIDPRCDGVVPADDAPGPGGVPMRANYVRELDRNYHQLPSSRLDMQLESGGKPAPFDPMHEFKNCCYQLSDLATPTMHGFAQDAYNSYAGKPGYGNIADLIPAVMNYIPFGDTPAQDKLPGLQGLARHFTVCDHWFCSLPGPTFANRFFAMMGSCHGKVLMPGDWHDAKLALDDYCCQVSRDSIFSLVNESRRKAWVYSQGHTPFAFMAKDGANRSGMDDFYRDAKAGKLPALSWLEPDYSYTGTDGCSQHPPEDLSYGDAFISDIYNALRANEGAWNKTLLVVMYDEHGGFYDHVVPPKTIAPDNCKADVNFDFTRLGPRVPVVLASPWLARTVDAMQYDHTSLLAFICDRFGLDKSRLGQRCASTQHFGNAPIWLEAPRNDTPPALRRAPQPPRSQADKDHETPLASQIGSLIEVMHAKVMGKVQDDLWQKLRPLGRLLGIVRSPEQLGSMIDEIVTKLKTRA